MPRTVRPSHGLPSIVELNQFARDLGAAGVRCFLAGDYVWQGRQFERAILGSRKHGWIARLWNVYSYVTSLAVFHPIHLRDEPDTAVNRFYLFIEKKCPGM